MKKTLKFLKEHKQFTFFGILAILIILAAIFAPLLTGGVDPLKGALTEALEAPSKEHIFGTDKMGRDIYARVIYGFLYCIKKTHTSLSFQSSSGEKTSSLTIV